MASINIRRNTMLAGRTRLNFARPSIRPIHQSALSRYPHKDAQHKDSINTDSTEYSKSGSDDQAAQQDDPAYDPNQTDPARQKKKAGEVSKDGNPLEVSPANKDVSSGTKGEQAERGGKAEKGGAAKKSGPGSPTKGKKV